MRRPRLLFVVNVDWFFISHRMIIAENALKLGWEVYVACEDTGRSAEIKAKGIKFINFEFSRSGINPLQEIKTLNNFVKLYKGITPDIVHHITLKPVIYGSVIARVLKVKAVVNAISGLGYNFTGDRKSLVQKFMLKLMNFGFNRKNIKFIFQNDDDFNELRNLGIAIDKDNVIKIKGSGVNLIEFSEKEFPPFDKIIILFPVRMLWDKGVKELREATDLLKEKYSNKIKFILAGLADNDNKAGVPKEYLEEWSYANYVNWVGYEKNMVNLYANSHIVVLPSYREGMPKSLIEACAIGRPIVTTNAIGCTECVDEDINGYKVPVYSVAELSDAIKKLVDDPNKIIEFGKASRAKAEKEFDVKNVVEKHLDIYKLLLK